MEIVIKVRKEGRLCYRALSSLLMLFNQIKGECFRHTDSLGLNNKCSSSCKKFENSSVELGYVLEFIEQSR